MGDEPNSKNPTGGSDWTFLSNHAHVLLCIAREPGILLREVAERVGITERAVQRIVADLEQEGYLSRNREGRRNRYEVHADRPLRHPVEAHREVSVLLDLILGPGGDREPRASHPGSSSDGRSA
jgi:DNA-binding transcriptional ArsR family regulator